MSTKDSLLRRRTFQQRPESSQEWLMRVVNATLCRLTVSGRVWAMSTESKDQQGSRVSGGAGVQLVVGHPRSMPHRAGVGSVCHESLEGWNDLVTSAASLIETLLSVSLRG